MSVSVKPKNSIYQDTCGDIAIPAAERSNVLSGPRPSIALQHPIALIDESSLLRDCFASALRSRCNCEVLSFPTVQQWLQIGNQVCVSAVVLTAIGQTGWQQTRLNLQRLMQDKRPVPVMVFSDIKDFSEIFECLDMGVKGYISTDLPLDIAVEAIRLVKAGGTFVPASCLSAARAERESPKRAIGNLFTKRQAAVIEALRQGKPNKTIAYELNMCESTVKVHIRNIMKKLKAKNRTEVAYITNKLENRSLYCISEQK